jgi:hypothetical protein
MYIGTRFWLLYKEEYRDTVVIIQLVLCNIGTKLFKMEDHMLIQESIPIISHGYSILAL